MRHSIRKQTLNVTVGSQELAWELQPRLRAMNRNHLLPVIERALDELAVTGLHIRIPALNLDLGQLPDEGFESIAAERLDHALREALGDAIAAANANAGSEFESQSEDESRVEALAHYLQFGKLPFWGPHASSFSLETALVELLEHDSGGALRLLRKVGQFQWAIQRLVLQLSESTLDKLVDLLEPESSVLIIAYIFNLCEVQRQAGIAALSESKFAELLWSLSFAYLLQDESSQFSSKRFVRYLIEHVAGHESIRFHELLCALEIALMRLKNGGSSQSSLVAIISEFMEEEWAEHAVSTADQPLESSEQSVPPSAAETVDLMNEESILALIRELQPQMVDGENLFLTALQAFAAEAHDKRTFYSCVLTAIKQERPLDLEELLKTSNEHALAASSSSLRHAPVRQARAFKSEIPGQFRSGNLAPVPEAGGSGTSATPEVSSPIFQHEPSAEVSRQAIFAFLDRDEPLTGASIDQPGLPQIESPSEGEKPSYEQPKNVLTDESFACLLREGLESEGLETPSDELRAFIVRRITDVGARERCAATLPEPALERIAAILAPDRYRILLNTLEVLQAALAQSLPWAGATLVNRRNVWLFFLGVIEKDLSVERLVGYFFQHFSVACRQQITEPTRHDAVGAALIQHATLLASTKGFALLVATFHDYAPTLLNLWRMPDAPIPDFSKQSVGQQERLQPQKEQLRGIRAKAAFGLSQDEELLPASEPIYIDNAGLVLAAPFLPNLFNHLKMLWKDESGKTRWQDPERASRAVHLLQYLVDGRVNAPEPLLVLNKLLCGLPIAMPIEKSITMTEPELEGCQKLLQSILANWNPLSGTSIAGLRETFFQRQGRLEKPDTAWKLHVQRKTVDVLVDQVPWSIAVIFHPWMPGTLHVTW